MDYFGNQIDISRFVAVTHKYIFDGSLLASQLLTAQRVNLNGNPMYFAIMRLMCVATGHFRCQIYTDSSNRYHSATIGATNDRVRDECLFGTASRPAVLPVPIIIPGTGGILLDLEDVSAAPNTLHLVFEGVNLYPAA